MAGFSMSSAPSSLLAARGCDNNKQALGGQTYIIALNRPAIIVGPNAATQRNPVLLTTGSELDQQVLHTDLMFARTTYL